MDARKPYYPTSLAPRPNGLRSSPAFPDRAAVTISACTRVPIGPRENSKRRRLFFAMGLHAVNAL